MLLICRISSNFFLDVCWCLQTGNIVLGEPDERILGLHLIKFAEVQIVWTREWNAKLFRSPYNFIIT